MHFYWHTLYMSCNLILLSKKPRQNQNKNKFIETGFEPETFCW